MPVKRSALLFILFLHIGCMQNDNDTEPKPEHYRERVAEALEKASYAQENEAEALRQAVEWRVRYGVPTLAEQEETFWLARQVWIAKLDSLNDRMGGFLRFDFDDYLPNVGSIPKRSQFVGENDWDRAAEKWRRAAWAWEDAAEEWNAAAVGFRTVFRNGRKDTVYEHAGINERRWK